MLKLHNWSEHIKGTTIFQSWTVIEGANTKKKLQNQKETLYGISTNGYNLYLFMQNKAGTAVLQSKCLALKSVGPDGSRSGRFFLNVILADI